MWEEIMIDEFWEKCTLVKDLGMEDAEWNRFVVKDEYGEFYMTTNVLIPQNTSTKDKIGALNEMFWIPGDAKVDTIEEFIKARNSAWMGNLSAKDKIEELNKMMGIEMPDFLKDMIEDGENMGDGEERKIREVLKELRGVNPIKIVKILAENETQKFTDSI